MKLFGRLEASERSLIGKPEVLDAKIASSPSSASAALINVLWLLPIAWLAAEHERAGFVLAIVAFLPLIALTIWFERTETHSVTNSD